MLRHAVLLPFLVALPLISATQLTNDGLQKVHDVMNAISTRSWENGTKAQAILEYDYPDLSVFSSKSMLLANPLKSDQIRNVIPIAEMTLQKRPAANSSASLRGGASLLSDGSAADPASLGVAVLLANASTGNGQVNGVGYGDAATAELNYLLYDVPRTPSGAISHRADLAQYWADFVYMVPPFLAYYGATTNNQTLLQTAYTQCSLYRDELRQSTGLWYHITGGSGNSDRATWTTGNAWAAAGMSRVWATIMHSPFAGDMGGQMGDLQSWIGEILGATQTYITTNGLLRNYLEDPTSFEETSGSALIAATGLRMATLNLGTNYVNSSLTLLSAVSTRVNSSGYLTEVVNPNDFLKVGTDSPEGQSFVILAYAAYRDWDKMGRPGESAEVKNPLGEQAGAGRRAASVGMVLVGVVAGVAGLVWVIA